MNRFGGETNHRRLELAIDSSAVCAAGGEVEGRRKKVIRAVLEGKIENVSFDLGERERAKIGRTKPCSETIPSTRAIGEINGTLGKLDVVFPAEYDVGSWRCCRCNCEVGEIVLELDADELDASGAAVTNGPILVGKEGRKVTSHSRVGDSRALRVVPGEDRQMMKVRPIPREFALPIGESRLGHEHQIEPVSQVKIRVR